MTLPLPDTIGRYEVQKCLGQGSMGIVYLAKDPSALKRLVAIKVLRVDDDEMRARFEREAELIGQFRHNHIVSVYDVGDHDGRPFITMEYVPGETLANKISNREPLTLGRRLALIEALCDGLAYAHARNVIHRDVKPANLVIDDDGELRILDFGIARSVASTGLTQLGMVMGTPRYMSPEQLDNPQVDHRSDIFSVGSVLYELLCYEPAFPGDQLNFVTYRIVHEAPRSLKELDARLPAGLTAVVDRALQKQRDKRYQSLTAMKADLVRIRTSLDADTLSATVTRVRRAPARWWSWRMGAAAAAITVATGLWAVLGGVESLQEWGRSLDPTVTTERVENVEAAPGTEATPPNTADEDRWTTFQTEMAEQHAALMSLDAAADLAPAEKSAAWRQFLATFTLQNPQTEEDDRLRTYAYARVGFWNTQSDLPADGPAEPAPATPPTTGPDPEQVRMALDQAQQLFIAGSYSAAVAAFEAVLSLDATNATARSGTAAARQMVQIDAALQQADTAFEQGSFEAAAAAYESVLVLDLANAAALNGLARIRPPTNPTTGQMWVSPVDRREMRWVPPGDFQMGSPESEPDRDEDETQHPVTFARGYWIDAGEVTYREYQRFVVTNPEWSKDNIARNVHDGNYLTDWSGIEFPAGKADQPVANVSWHAARAYASWAGKRLPTESEWEYAGRSGATTAYWWGDTFTPRRAGVEPGPSADRRNAWGLSDMLGGVWEWTASVYQDYPYRAEDGRERAADTGQRVVRGGASVNSGRMLRVANRNPAPPELSNDSVGFRCAR